MVVFMPDVMHSIAKVLVACRNTWILANGDGCSVVHCQATVGVAPPTRPPLAPQEEVKIFISS